MLVSELFKNKNIKIKLESEDKDSLFEEMVSFLVDAENLNCRDEILEAVLDRESKMSTGIAPHIALPHANIPQIKKTVGVLGISLRGIDYDALDGKPVYIVMMIIGNSESPLEHLKTLKNIAALIANPEFFPSILKCKTPKDISDHIVDFEDLSKFKEN